MNRLIETKYDYSIHKVDPTKVYLVKDLYSLGEDTIHKLPRNTTLTTLLHKISYTVEELAIFFNKPMSQCTEEELKLLYLLVLHKYKDKLQEDKKSKMRDIHRIYLCDSVDTILCFLSEIESTPRYPANREINLKCVDVELQYFISLPRRDLKSIRIKALPYINKHYVIYKKYPFMRNNHSVITELYYDRCQANYLRISDCKHYRSPFLEIDDLYPKHYLDDTPSLRLRDLLYIGHQNTNNRWMTFIDKNSRTVGKTKDEYIKYVHKPQHEWTHEDLDAVVDILTSIKSYNTYYNNFVKIENRLRDEIEYRNI